MPSPLRPVFWTLLPAFVFWFFTFAFPAGNFWLKLVISASILAGLGLSLSRSHWGKLFHFEMRHLWLGPLSAIFLYGVFWLGKEFSTFLFPFASREISTVYFNKAQLNTAAIGFLLFFIMGPAEEIYWHGFVQRSFVERLGRTAGLFLTTGIYALVHIFAFNFMLLIAAAVCGFFWGWLYQREQSLIPVILSHSIWDVLVFVLFPLT